MVPTGTYHVIVTTTEGQTLEKDVSAHDAVDAVYAIDEMFGTGELVTIQGERAGGFITALHVQALTR